MRWALKLVYPRGSMCVLRALTPSQALNAISAQYGEPQPGRRFREIDRHRAEWG